MSNFPKELTATARWLNFTITSDGRKIPLATKTSKAAFRAGTPRSDSYARFDSACRFNPWVKGGNLGLDIDTPFFAVDLDKVIDAGGLTARGRELAAQLPPTYAEYSPSGRGLHLWYRVRPEDHAKLPNATFAPSFECYSRLRWFTMTDQPYGSIRSVKQLPLRRALAVFAIGTNRRPSTASGSHKKVIRSDEPGLWSVDAMDCFLSASRWAYRKYDDRSFRVWCPGIASWKQHDDDELRGNATTVTIANGYPMFYCHHAKCAGKRWRDFVDIVDPGRRWSLERWIIDRHNEISRTFRAGKAVRRGK